MGFRQIVIFRRQVARKILKSSNEAVQSRHGLCPYSVGENHARHSTDWSWYLQSPSQTPVYLPCLHVDKDNDEKYNPHKVINLLYLPAKQLVRLPERKLLRDATTAELLRDARELVLPLGVRWMSHSTRSSSTATASQHAISSQEDDKEEHALKKRQIEASPEECDQAVEGLSTAKAKAKQVHESQKRDENFVRKFWSRLTGIGPALRAVASMSREDWAQKLQQWRKDFSAAMQHYWIGTKLLWADVRICFRLLLKLASGKSLSRRERQQLTRTTADIFRLVPFAVFIIVPFLEFLLPVFLKVFPNMLPSTFQDKMKEEILIAITLFFFIKWHQFEAFSLDSWQW